MSKLSELNYNELTRRLKLLEFRFYRHGKGSHELWVRDKDGLCIPVPNHKGKPIRKGTLRAIIKEIGISVEKFMDL
ncbi:MAG: type II toxin-antitoxin system HicA family toxin [Brevinematia bacterium]